MDQRKVDLTGVIILRSSELESALRRAGASGAGLHELTESLAPTLSADLVKKLHYIGAVRNQVAHEAVNAPAEEIDVDAFNRACDEVLAVLNPGEASAPAPQVPAVNEEELVRGEYARLDFDRFFRRAALIPGGHVLYPLYLLVISLKKARAPGAGMLGYFLFILFLTIAIQHNSRPWLWPAGICFAASWIYGAIDGWCRRKIDELPQMVYLGPGVNLLYFLYRIAQLTDKLRFFGALSMLAAIFSAVYLLVFYHEYRAGLIVLGAGYAVGAVMALVESFQARAVAEEEAQQQTFLDK
ncbi:MAG: hypothetical protein AB7F32_03375 [Victivallaceae bacterium]